MDRNSVHVYWKPVQHPVFPVDLVLKALRSVNGVAKDLVRVVGKPTVPNLDVASDPCFLIASFNWRDFRELIAQSLSNLTRMKVTIRYHQKR